MRLTEKTEVSSSEHLNAEDSFTLRVMILWEESMGRVRSVAGRTQLEIPPDQCVQRA